MSGAVTARRAQRVNKGKEEIRRDMLQTKSLSWKARGLLSYCISLPEQWECHGVAGLARASDNDGYEATNNAVKELEAAGLFVRLKRQGKSRQWEWLWTYSDDPSEVAAEVAKWVGEGYRVSTNRGGNKKAKGRPDQQALDDQDNEAGQPEPEPVSGKPEHGSPDSPDPATVSGFSGHGSPEYGPAGHGEPRNIDVHSTGVTQDALPPSEVVRASHARTREDTPADPPSKRSRPAAAHVPAAELNRTAHGVGARRIIDRWRQGHETPHRYSVYREISKEVDQLLKDGADPSLILVALRDWDFRGKTSGFLKNCYDDAVHDSRPVHERRRTVEPRTATSSVVDVEVEAAVAGLVAKYAGTGFLALPEGAR
ncbi:MAG TPA: hypothetical protein VGJ13_19910 [Pseudonocardiaceae bacterium]